MRCVATGPRTDRLLQQRLVGCTAPPAARSPLRARFTGAQGTAFQSDLTAWAKYKNITVKYRAATASRPRIVTQVKGGTAPDIAIFPQPGVLKSLVSQGMVPLDDMIDVKSVTSDEATVCPTSPRWTARPTAFRTTST